MKRPLKQRFFCGCDLVNQLIGWQIQKLNPGGSRIRYDYDTLNALADKKYEDAQGEESDHPVQMGYNSMGQRISMEDITGGSSLSRNNIWNEARDVNHDEMSYYLYDGQGSVTANTWYNGMVTDVYQYDPYGRMELGGEGHTDFYGCRAESYNPNTGLEYLRARYYNADKGRFFQEDTYLGDITEPLTLNRYAYVKNSPLNYADPSGHVAEYLTGPQYDPDDDWKANYYPLSQTGPEKTEFPIEIVSGTEAVEQFWGSVSEGLDHVMSQLKAAADLSLSQLRELRGWMKEAVDQSVVNVCENRVDLGAEIGETLEALISGALMGMDNAFNIPTDAMDEFFSSHALAYNIGKILGRSGTIAVLSLLAGLFLGGGAAAAGGATLALGGAMVVVSSSVIAIQWSTLTAGSLSLSVSDHSSGSGEVEEGEAETNKKNSGKSRAPETGTPGSIYEQVDDKGNVMSRTKYGENGRPEYREDLTGRPHYDKNTGKYLEQHRHNFKYNDKGQPIGETVTPIPD